jgi:hypothetical protein
VERCDSNADASGLGPPRHQTPHGLRREVYPFALGLLPFVCEAGQSSELISVL